MTLKTFSRSRRRLLEKKRLPQANKERG